MIMKKKTGSLGTRLCCIVEKMKANEQSVEIRVSQGYVFILTWKVNYAQFTLRPDHEEAFLLPGLGAKA